MTTKDAGTTAYGTFLAFSGDIFVDHATVNGALIGGSINIGSKYDGLGIQSEAVINQVLFQGNVVPVPSTIVMAGVTGVFGLAFGWLRRGSRNRLTRQPIDGKSRNSAVTPCRV